MSSKPRWREAPFSPAVRTQRSGGPHDRNHPQLASDLCALHRSPAEHFGVVLFSRALWRAAALARSMTAAAYWTLWAGAPISVITVAAGWYAFNTVKHDDAAHEMMIEHRNWAISTFLY